MADNPNNHTDDITPASNESLIGQTFRPSETARSEMPTHEDSLEEDMSALGNSLEEEQSIVGDVRVSVSPAVDDTPETDRAVGDAPVSERDLSVDEMPKPIESVADELQREGTPVANETQQPNAEDLIEAAKQGNIDEVNRILQLKPGFINTQDTSYQQTPLSWAAELGHVEVFKALYRAKADLTIEDKYGHTPIYWACYNNRHEVLSFFVAEASETSRKYYRGRNIFFLAAGHGSVEDVKRLVNSDPDIRDEDGLTPLMFACERSHQENVITLLDLGANASLKTAGGRTALHFAVMGDIAAPLILRLIASGCEVDAQDSDGETPLIRAARANKPNTINTLLDLGANASLKTAKGRTALHFTALNNITAPLILRLIASNCEVDARDSDGDTPLMCAARANKLDTVNTLLDKQANPKLSDYTYHQTPLMWAAENGNHEIVKRLCPISDVNASATGWRNMRAIHFAIGASCVQSLKHLLEAGAELYSVMDTKQDAITLALHARDKEQLIRTLIEYPRESNKPEGTTHLRLRAAELALRYNNEGAGGDSRIDELILNNEEYLKAVDEHGRNLVSWAAQGRNCELVEKLCQSPHVDFNLKDRDGRTPLSWAAGSGAESVVQLLVNKLEDQNTVGVADTDGRTPLHWAAQSGNPQSIKALLACGINVDSRDISERTPLSIAAAKGHFRAVKSLLEIGAANDSEDLAKRTPLSLAAEGGYENCVQLLLEQGVNPDSKDTDGKTPLCWASEKGQLAVVKTLLELRGGKLKAATRGDIRNKKDAQAVDTVRLGSEILKKDARAADGVCVGVEVGKKDARAVDGLRAGVEVNSRDNKLRTPLWYAAKEQHLAVFETLIIYGADPDLRDIDDRSLIHVLGEDIAKATQNAEIRTWKLIYEKLELYGSLWHQPSPDAAPVDKEFSATVLYIPKSDELDIDLRTMTVERLLQGRHLVVPQGKRCAWLHLPANNMRWVETLMAKHYEACGESHSWKFNVVLKPKFWEQQQHKSQDGSYHARYMRPACYPFVIRERPSPAKISQDTKPKEGKPKNNEKTSRDAPSQQVLHPLNEGSGPKQEEVEQDGYAEKDEQSGKETQPERGIEAKPGGQTEKSRQVKEKEQDMVDTKSKVEKRSPKKTDVPTEASRIEARGFVMFMPYLHWELESEHDKLKKIMKEKKALFREKDGESRHKAHVEAQLDDIELCGTEKLYWRYLDEKHPLHARRTLDQFYYHTLADTERRDKDQAVIRYYNNPIRKEDLQKQELEPVITMVDQLWMWVLPACGKSPETIITAFPQRSNRMLSNTSKSMTSLVSNIIERARELPERSAVELAQVIAAECSRIYLDPMSNRSELIQFLEIYTTSIGEITERETVRFDQFQASIRKNNEKTMGEALNLEPEAAVLEDPEVLAALLNVETDIEDLRQIKDIREELNIMSSVFHVQKRVMQAMDHILREPKDRRNGSDGAKKRMNSFPLTLANSYGILGAGAEDKNDQWMYHSTMLEVVNQNIDEVVRLDRFADRAMQAIQQLLDLKHKQANLIEEQLTRKLTKGILEINDKTDRQGNTIMYFTVATIIFLPLSFMASFLTIEVDEFPRGEGGNLSLDFVIKVILAVSIALIVPSVVVAFNLDPKEREKRKGAIRQAIQEASRRVSDAMNKSPQRPAEPVGSPSKTALEAPDSVTQVTQVTPGNTTLRDAWTRWTAKPMRWWNERQERSKPHDLEEGSGGEKNCLVDSQSQPSTSKGNVEGDQTEGTNTVAPEMGVIEKTGQ
ncbi:ankyrin repeat-containing domain protein [Triangularia verruculosa]|uniref:Ankyrin repeat-containing domain protein n=1 Tax=Triangularia verruculosa TaxID=2587418 RepID=A0AAN6X929_9PEZI|nr:ankyrin repeat-containing domain protein [Triangularia verruculosa]